MILMTSNCFYRVNLQDSRRRDPVTPTMQRYFFKIYQNLTRIFSFENCEVEELLNRKQKTQT